MTSVLLYLLKVSLSLTAVFLFYQLVLQRLTFYNWNRWYLLFYSFVSFLVPFIDISPVLEKNDWSGAGLVEWVPVLYQTASDAVSTSTHARLSAWDLVAFVLYAGMTIMTIRLLLQFISFYRMMKRAVLISGEKMKIYQVNDAVAPFSFGRSVFINRDQHSESELREIIQHEFVHIRQRHSIDIIWSELLCLINWFNPFAWLLKKAIRQNLEFIADSKVLQNGISKREYQYLLLKVTGNHQYSIATPFNFSSLKKRIAMMNKLQSAKVNLLRFLFILPLLAVILVSFRKEFSERLKQHKEPTILLPLNDQNDTIPEMNSANDRGYIIEVRTKDGNGTVVVKDKNRKEVARVPLSDWNKKTDHYEDLYGKLPPPPPPPQPGMPPALAFAPEPPSPPVPPAPKKLPDAVEKINVNNKAVTITLKDGTTESYDLSVPSQKKAFEKKYGDVLPEQPVPPGLPVAPVPASKGYSVSGAAEYELSEKKVTITFKDGRKEVYDLADPKQKKQFVEKYGEPVLSTTAAPAAPAHVPARGGVAITAPVPAVSRGYGGTTVIAPMAGGEPVVVAGDPEYSIPGYVDILVTITKNSSRQQLDELVRQMKAKNVDLSFDEVEYDEKGILVKISGKMKSKDGNSNFVAVEFNKLELAMIRDGEKTHFRVRTYGNKTVI